MKTEPRTVNQLFELDVRYVVPLYQRPYVWDKGEQWEPLWDDIVALLEHQLTLDDVHFSHFLGAIVLDQTTQTPGSIPQYTVIDGQQRLTTLQIVLAAAAAAADEYAETQEGEILRDLTRNDERKAGGTELFKVWPTNLNRNSFQAVMTPGGPPDGHADDPDNRIDEAYAFFLKQMCEWLKAMDVDERPAAVRRLRVVLSELLKVVAITLEADDNAQVIFETLNARGTPLLALDLVKNAVFLEASNQSNDPDHLYLKVWQPQLDDDYWRTVRRQGRLNRPVGELFLMHWLSMKLQRVVPATELFAAFRSHILGAVPPPAIDALIPEVCDAAAMMRSFDTQAAFSVEERFFRRLEALDTSTVLPLVLRLFLDKDLEVSRRERSLQMLESWLVRRMLMGLTTRSYNKQIPTLLTRVANDPARADEVILDDLSGSTGQSSRWPSDDEIRVQVATRGMYGYIAQPRIVMVLSAIEEALHNPKVEALQLPGDLSIEHLLPQKWQAEWPLDSTLTPAKREVAEASRAEHIHLLGNLTLTTGSLNAALSNAAWEKKRGDLNKTSKLLINQRIIDDNPDRWDEAAIDRRGKELADQIVTIWPGADAWG